MEKDLIEIVEYFDKTIPIYEVMTGKNFDKKQKKEPYEVLYKSVSIPFVVFDGERDNKIKEMNTTQRLRNKADKKWYEKLLNESRKSPASYQTISYYKNIIKELE